MTTSDIIKKVQNNGKELASKGSEAMEKAYKATLEILSHARHDAPELLTRLVRKGETEWDEARKIIENIFKERSEKLKTVQKDLFKGLEDLRGKIIKGSPIDLTVLFDLLRKIEERIGSLDLPFMKHITNQNGLPIDNYDDLSVKKILPHFDALSKEQLKVIRDYEKKHLNRVTIIREVNKICM